MFVSYVDTPQEMLNEFVKDLNQKLADAERKVRTYQEAVANKGSIAGVISGVRKKDIAKAQTEAGVYRSLLAMYEHMKLRPKADSPFTPTGR